LRPDGSAFVRGDQVASDEQFTRVAHFELTQLREKDLPHRAYGVRAAFETRSGT
jgi:hypothetical protein